MASPELEVSQSKSIRSAITAQFLYKYPWFSSAAQCPLIHRALNLLLLPSLRRNWPTRCPRSLYDPSKRYHHHRQDSHPKSSVHASATACGQYIYKGDILERFHGAVKRNVQYSPGSATSVDGDQFRQSYLYGSLEGIDE